MSTQSTNAPHPDPEITDKAARAAHDAVDRFADRAAKAETTIREKAATSNEKIQDSKVRAREQIDHTARTVDSFARENPLATAGIAFAAGALISTLLRR